MACQIITPVLAYFSEPPTPSHMHQNAIRTIVHWEEITGARPEIHVAQACSDTVPQKVKVKYAYVSLLLDIPTIGECRNIHSMQIEFF